MHAGGREFDPPWLHHYRDVNLSLDAGINSITACPRHPSSDHDTRHYRIDLWINKLFNNMEICNQVMIGNDQNLNVLQFEAASNDVG